MMTSYLGSFAYESWKLTKIMPNFLRLLDHYILSNAPQKIRQWALKVISGHICITIIIFICNKNHNNYCVKSNTII